MNPRIIAIDPGKSGGIAVRDDWTSDTIQEVSVTCYPMPKTEVETVYLLRGLMKGRPCVVFIEKVGGYISRGFQPGSRMFTFGENYGFLKGLILATIGSIELVPPQRWQTALGLSRDEGMPPHKWKKYLMLEARSRFPETDKVSLATSDALLLLAYVVQERDRPLVDSGI